MASRPGRVTGKAAKRNKWWMKRRNQWIGGGLLVAIIAATGISVALDDSSSATPKATPGSTWRDGITADFTTMSNTALNYLKTINDWKTGKAKDAEVDAAADNALQQFLLTRDLLVDRVTFEQAPRALPDYRDSVELYIAHARLAKLGAQIKDPDLNRQIQLIMGRLRYLADRLYDLGSDEMKPFAGGDLDEVAGFSYARTVDVPSFSGTDLAPGPPLTLAKPAAAEVREYQKVRPEGDFATWQQAIEAARIPSAEAEAKAIKNGSQDELNKLSDQLTAASDHLHASPDPMDERELSTRVQLGLLVQAEAMRTAQVSKLVTDKLRPEAVEISQVLALLGNAMWDTPRLGARDTGFPATLLTIRPKVAPPAIVYDLCPTAGPTASATPAGTPTTTPAGTPVPTPVCDPATIPTGDPAAIPTGDPAAVPTPAPAP